MPVETPVFADLVFKPKPRGGLQAKVLFANGYGASVITGPGAYGGEEGLYELAVLHDGSLCYDTPITDDVEGRLTEDEVTSLLAEIAALPLQVMA